MERRKRRGWRKKGEEMEYGLLTEIKAVHRGLTQRPHVRAVRITLPEQAPQHDGSTTRIRRVNEGDGAARPADAEEDLLAVRLARLDLSAEFGTCGQAGGVAVIVGVLGGAGCAEVDDGEAVGGLEAADIAQDDGVDGVIFA